MAGKTYVSKGYSTYTYIPHLHGGYDHGPENPINQYAVDSKTIERVQGRPPVGYTDYVGSPSKVDVHSPTITSSPKTGYSPNYWLNYGNSSPPIFNEGSRWTMRTSNISSSNKYYAKSSVHGYHSEEAHARHVRYGDIHSSNKYWQSAGPPMAHPLTTSTDNIKEALVFLDAVNHSAKMDSHHRTTDELSTRAQSLEPQKRYAGPAFVAKPHDIYKNRHWWL
ncbi:hypothetical protein L1887_15361 [Cichorium endivia]|nr:hypothetical protein L1887_15361 [Cichorium endivia]